MIEADRNLRIFFNSKFQIPTKSNKVKEQKKKNERWRIYLLIEEDGKRM
jgi:hypothetical protein